MPVLAPAFIIGAAVATGASLYYGQKANNASKEAASLQRKQNALQAARQRRDAIRSSRIAYAQASQAAENQGVSGSSASEGGLGSITSQMNANLSFLDQSKVLGDMGSQALGRAASYEYKAGVSKQVAGLAMSGYNNSDQIVKLFSGGAA